MWPTIVLALLAAAAHLQPACASTMRAHHARGSSSPCIYSCPTFDKDANSGSRVNPSAVTGDIECQYAGGEGDSIYCFYSATTGVQDVDYFNEGCPAQAVANCSRRRSRLRGARRPRSVPFEDLPQYTDIIIEDDQQPW